jgi:hypothetical protein
MRLHESHRLRTKDLLHHVGVLIGLAFLLAGHATANAQTTVVVEAENAVGARGWWVWRAGCSGLKTWRLQRDTDFATLAIVLPGSATDPPKTYRVALAYTLDWLGQPMQAALDGIPIEPFTLENTRPEGTPPGSGWNSPRSLELTPLGQPAGTPFMLLPGIHHLTLRIGPTLWGAELDLIRIEEVP